MSPEQQAKTLIEDGLGKWEIAGATPENQDKWISATDSLSYLNQLAAENTKLRTQALFIPDWESHDDLSQYVHATERNNASSLEDYFKTYRSYNEQDKEPYTNGMSVQKIEVVNQDTDTITLLVHATEFNNSAKNRIATLDPGQLKINGNRVIFTVTLKTIDGVQKIAILKCVNDPTQ